MANIKEWLLSAEKHHGEEIEAIVVGPHDRAWLSDAPVKPDENIILSREDGLAKLDQEFDDGYGSSSCFPMFAWTKSRVFWIAEYDGATGLNWAPRHPTPGEPEFSGNA